MIEKLYRRARSRHGDIYRDVVHDLVCKFGSDLPSIAYLNKCIDHAKPPKIQEMVEVEQEDGIEIDNTEILKKLMIAIDKVRSRYELEVDTFLECKVNGSFKSFEEHSGIARSVLEKICKFAQNEILNEYNRIHELA